MSKIKRLAGETVLYGMGSMLPKFLNFLLVRLHTEVFPPDQYGVITKLLSYVAVLNVLYTFGMETAYFRFATREGADERKVFNITQTVVVTISLAFTLGLIAFATPITNALDLPGSEHVIIWISLIMFVDAIVSIPFARLRLQKKARLFVMYRLANIFVLIGLNVYFLRYAFNPAIGINYIFVANMVANMLYLIFFIRVLLSWRPAYDPVLSPRIFTYAYPVMITGLAGMTNEMFSRLTLDSWLPANFYPGRSPEYAVGIFGACYKFGMFMNLTIQAFRYAAEPFFFSNATDKNSPTLFATINHYFVIVCCIILLGVSVNMDLIKYFLGDAAYFEGIGIVPILLLGFLFLGVYYNLSVWFKLTDKTYYGTIITVGGVIVTIVGNYFLIPVAGYTGSSWAMLLCYFLMTVANYLLGQRYYPIPYRVFSDMAYILSTALLVWVVNRFDFGAQVLNSTFHFTVVAVYLLVIYLIEKTHFKRSAT
ncbi:MAG TPA: oligosaccharide flippase family protein [Chryseolinea sp.]|nr:oligosaccharide flippase family protein [Chryseolinea sp.]